MLQKMAWGYGGLFVAIGILGFIPLAAPGAALFGIFTVGTSNDIIYLLAGILGLAAAYSSQRHSRLYFKVFGILFALATVIGFLQGDSVLGIAMVNAADNVFHLIIAAVALWAGFGSGQPAHLQQTGMAM